MLFLFFIDFDLISTKIKFSDSIFEHFSHFCFYVSYPARFHRISGFENWCEIDESGSGSGAGSGTGSDNSSDELVAVSSKKMSGKVTVTVGSDSDPNEFNWYYCYPTNKGETDC